MSMDSRNTAALITSGTNVMLHIWREFFSKKKPALPAKVAEVRRNPQLAREETDFMRRRDSRENEFLEIQKYRFEADMRIAAAQADREERALKLRHQEIEDNRKLGRMYLEAVRDQTVKEMNMRHKELQALYDQGRWHCVFSRHEIEQIFGDEKEKHRLLMLISEPDIIETLPQSFRESLKKELRNKLKSFVEEYYPIDSDLCPVEFYGKYFDRAVFDAEIKQLESVMPVHTAIIYSDITDHEVYFNVRLSGLEKPLSFSTKPWDWEQAKHQLEKDGCGEIQSERQIREIIVRFHQVLAAFLADWYFLNINPHYEPRLFAFQSELPDVLPQEWIGGCVEELRKAKEAYLAELKRQVEEEETRRREEEKLRSQAEEKAEAECKRKEEEERQRRQTEEERRKWQYKDNGDGTITDYLTGLMWQQSGSPKHMKYENAKAYVEKLNRDRFAGHKDWRLPTLDELKTLVTSDKQSNGCYIYPIFNDDQHMCWSSDRHGSDRMWYIFFLGGEDNIRSRVLDAVCYVRAVRSLTP